MSSPLKIVKRIGDKLIRDTPFEYCLEVRPTRSAMDRMHFVDFGKTFCTGRRAVAYAWTRLIAPQAMDFTLELEHNDGCKIWLNNVLVYEQAGDRDIALRFEERSLEMSHTLQLQLREGANTLLIKSETRGKEWRVYLQAPSTNGAVLTEAARHPEIGLHGVKNISAQVADLSNWLVIGPFPNPSAGGERTGLDVSQAPESEFKFGRMYPGLDHAVTWTIPKVEVLGAMIDPLPWGTNYDWNYHNAGVAWAMQALAETSGESKYSDYASRFCDYHLGGIPFVEYQVKNLNAVDSANHFIIDTPLLDFTLAPSLPLIQRLRTGGKFSDRERYAVWIDRMLEYAKEGQVRLPGHDIFTRTTPEKYTTWVDDMFMGIPFLVQAALYSEDPVMKALFFDDAAHQVLEFNTQVWDPDENLYMHARYFGNPAKLPYWSRCNGWAIWAMSEVLLHLPKNHPKYAAVLRQFQLHSASLLRRQGRNGFWRNVLNRPDSEDEVSGTAIFVMAFARGLTNGWLDEAEFFPAVTKGWAALETAVESDGTVHRICRGTMCTEDVNYYVNREFYDNDTHGLFAVLFAGVELERLLASRTPAPEPALEPAISGANV